MVTVCTVLPPPERPRLDAVGDGCFTTLHASSFRDALRAARRKRVDALVLSVHACRSDELPAVARFVREFPAIPAVALVSRHDRSATETLLKLGATGVRSAVDCTEPAGWQRLRDLVGHPASPVAARILARACRRPRRTWPACGWCTPPIFSRTPGSPSPTWHTAWTIRHRRASGATSRRCWASRRVSSGAAFLSRCRSSATWTC